MRIISLTETKRINGITVKIDEFSELKFTRYGVNEFGTYVAEVLFEGVKFDDPADLFDNIKKSKKEIERLRRKALKEIAEKLFPGLKRLYFEQN